MWANTFHLISNGKLRSVQYIEHQRIPPPRHRICIELYIYHAIAFVCVYFVMNCWIEHRSFRSFIFLFSTINWQAQSKNYVSLLLWARQLWSLFTRSFCRFPVHSSLIILFNESWTAEQEDSFPVVLHLNTLDLCSLRWLCVNVVVKILLHLGNERSSNFTETDSWD